MEAIMRIEEVNGVKVVSSFTVCEELGVQHKNLLDTIEKYLPEIEGAFGAVAFQTRELKTTQGNKYTETSAYLTEDQAIFVSTLSRNSQQVVQFKARLVQAFQAARKFIQQVTAPLSKEETILQAVKYLQADVEMLQEENRLLEKTIKQQAPKAEYAEKVLSATNCYTITSIAKEFGMGGETLNKILHENKVQYETGGQWLLYARYQDKGYTETRTSKYTGSDGTTKTSHLTVWTERGRAFIHFKMKEWFPEGYIKPKQPKKTKASTLTVRYSL